MNVVIAVPDDTQIMSVTIVQVSETENVAHMYTTTHAIDPTMTACLEMEYGKNRKKREDGRKAERMTLIRMIKGLTNKTGLKQVPLMIHFTSDSLGETLSVTSEQHNIQLTMKYSDIEKIVARERAKGYKDGHEIEWEGWGEDA